jgi:hypothetical protein
MLKAITGLVIGAFALPAAAGCSSSQSVGTFHPAGPASTQTSLPAGGDSQSPAATSGFVMPPFGKNVHIEMTSWLPGNAAEAQAVNVDKDYKLAFLYAEYKAGQDQGWLSYVAPVMQSAVSAALRAPDVTTESFIGTIKYFDMSVIPDPLSHGDLDVSGCFDNAGSSNTNLRTGAVLPDSTPADQDYLWFTDQLAKDSAGRWQVVGYFPVVYYPRAKECKP